MDQFNLLKDSMYVVITESHTGIAVYENKQRHAKPLNDKENSIDPKEYRIYFNDLNDAVSYCKKNINENELYDYSIFNERGEQIFFFENKNAIFNELNTSRKSLCKKINNFLGLSWS